eukprot:m.176835 g.176835  ORF g.176835 m.176835 type:complete len:339 (-) comp17953_c2_seq1:188-1204(-)
MASPAQAHQHHALAHPHPLLEAQRQWKAPASTALPPNTLRPVMPASQRAAVVLVVLSHTLNGNKNKKQRPAQTSSGQTIKHFPKAHIRQGANHNDTRPSTMGERLSFSLTTFSPSGKLVQIEYAFQAVQGGNTSLGIKSTNGVVIATEKKMPSVLVDETTLHKVVKITDTAGMVYSGMGPDSRILTEKGRKLAQKYYRVYHEDIPTRMLVQELAGVMQEYTQRGGVRPFGVSLLVAGMDDDGTGKKTPALYQVDPSGSYFAWKATAIGKNMVNAKTFLEKRYNTDLELEDAVYNAILTLKEGFEGQMTEHNIELGIVDQNGFRRLQPSEVKDYLAATP